MVHFRTVELNVLSVSDLRKLQNQISEEIVSRQTRYLQKWAVSSTLSDEEIEQLIAGDGVLFKFDNKPDWCKAMLVIRKQESAGVIRTILIKLEQPDEEHKLLFGE